MAPFTMGLTAALRHSLGLNVAKSGHVRPRPATECVGGPRAKFAKVFASFFKKKFFLLFFFEKKNQKTFANWVWARWAARRCYMAGCIRFSNFSSFWR
jgi:hypothetical protein